jgi:hypothetical protein
MGASNPSGWTNVIKCLFRAVDHGQGVAQNYAEAARWQMQMCSGRPA